MHTKQKEKSLQPVYLSGPMSGIKDNNRPAFEAARSMLTSLGVQVVSPVSNGVPPGSSWEEHLRADIRLLTTCQTIAMLPGWRTSRGAKLERKVAKGLNMQVLELDWPSLACGPKASPASKIRYGFTFPPGGMNFAAFHETGPKATGGIYIPPEAKVSSEARLIIAHLTGPEGLTARAKCMARFNSPKKNPMIARLAAALQDGGPMAVSREIARIEEEDERAAEDSAARRAVMDDPKTSKLFTQICQAEDRDTKPPA